jgi:hypothetical protein
MLVYPSRNSIRDHAYQVQIEYYKIPVKRLELQRRWKACSNEGQRYKIAYVSKKISAKNKKDRVEYGKNHLHHTIHNFWQYVFFSDETHIDPSLQGAGYILRERSHRLDTENIQERGEKTGGGFQVAGWCNWWAKCEILEVYNEKDTYIEGPTKPPKPRWRPIAEIEEEFALRITEWEASIGHEKEVKLNVNAMIQKYYVERLLPLYINAIHKTRLHSRE